MHIVIEDITPLDGKRHRVQMEVHCKPFHDLKRGTYTAYVTLDKYLFPTDVEVWHPWNHMMTKVRSYWHSSRFATAAKRAVENMAPERPLGRRKKHDT